MKKDQKEILLQKQHERLKIIERIKELEKEGGESFFQDVENDPPSATLQPHHVDYLKKKISSKIKGAIANFMAVKYKKTANKNHAIEVRGIEHLHSIYSGAIVISNHFSPHENMAVKTAVDMARPKHKFYAVIREGNYFMPGVIGFGLKNYRTLPLSSNTQTMRNFDRAITKLLNKKNWILIYPEQAMWWNYRKPKAFKIGAFHYAVKNNVPIVPMFVTMTDLETVDDLGFPQQKYTVHIFPPIYKNDNLSVIENRAEMMKTAHKLWVEKYEEWYGVKLSYDGSNFIQPVNLHELK